jgi:hypothetical protein
VRQLFHHKLLHRQKAPSMLLLCLIGDASHLATAPATPHHGVPTSLLCVSSESTRWVLTEFWNFSNACERKKLKIILARNL